MKQSEQHISTFLVVPSLILLSAQIHSQEIHGKVENKNTDVSNVHVINISSNRAAITNQDGHFWISAKINDTIVFSAIQFEPKQIIVTDKIYNSELFLVYLRETLTKLDEVVVRPNALTGYLDQDVGSLDIGNVVSSTSQKLPNVNVNLINSMCVLKTVS